MHRRRRFGKLIANLHGNIIRISIPGINQPKKNSRNSTRPMRSSPIVNGENNTML
jgi:hypothetical protein